MITPPTTKTAYNEWHEGLAVDHLADTPWHRLVKTHLSASRDLVGKRVLEIGCGRGGFACWLASQQGSPREMVAADFSPSAVQKGKHFAAGKGLTQIRWEVMDIENIAHPDGSFDTVISCETIEHVPSPQKAVRELGRILKPGGRLFLTTPNYMGLPGLHRIYVGLTGREFKEEGQPINNFMLLPRTRKLVVKAGLTVKKVDAIGHYLPFPGRPPIEMPVLNNPRFLMRWTGLHSLTIGEKPGR
ncbi:MAG TPA: class I SAM-dependent methyltransferase [Bryobacteraceae bacterium]|jgi:2-polyprenyl-3-methyl-5-hydroxy-6-metoxy-1,4-benzoquinol methylase|nr:class I SAM-dependent methyltransferase [Bryobacteraceae bacterium]